MQLRALSADQLRAIVRSAVVDAIIVLTVPLANDSFVSDIRFQVPGVHWAGAYSRLRVDSIRAEAVPRAQRLARYRLARTAPVALRDLDRASVLLRPGLWAIACRINGALSAQDLAWQCGLALYETIEGVGELLQAGLCALSPAAAVQPLADAARTLAPESPVPVHPGPALAISRPSASGPGAEVIAPGRRCRRLGPRRPGPRSQDCRRGDCPRHGRSANRRPGPYRPRTLALRSRRPRNCCAGSWTGSGSSADAPARASATPARASADAPARSCHAPHAAVRPPARQ